MKGNNRHVLSAAWAPKTHSLARYSSTSPTNSSLSTKDKLKRAVKDYGATVVVFHVAISITSLSICYAAVARFACLKLAYHLQRAACLTCLFSQRFRCSRAVDENRSFQRDAGIETDGRSVNFSGSLRRSQIIRSHTYEHHSRLGAIYRSLFA